MKFCDYKRLNVRQLALFTDAPSPPVGTRIRRHRYSNTFDRLFLNLEAEVIQTYAETRITIHDGDVVLIPRDVVYTDEILAAGHSLILYVDFSPEMPNGIFRWSFAGNPEMKQRFLNIQNLWNQKKTGYYTQCMVEVYSILSMIIRQEKTSYTNSVLADVIAPAIACMKERFSDPKLAIPSLAEQCGLSYSHFRKLFFDIHGVSASAYLKKLRLDYARQLLPLGDYTVAQIAKMTGFSDVYYFSSFFKRHTGMTPTEYQQKKWRK